jgi:hypothetical protein
MNLTKVFTLAVFAVGGAMVCIGRLRPASSAPPAAVAGSAVPVSLVTAKIDNGSEAFAPRSPHAAPAPGEMRQMTIKRLGNFDYETSKTIPDDVKALDGVKIRLTGFMLINWESEHIHEFSLIPSLFTCCYGEPPAIEHIVHVVSPPQAPVEYTDTPITVEGVLTVKEIKEDGYVTSVFKIAATKIAAAPQ